MPQKLIVALVTAGLVLAVAPLAASGQAPPATGDEAQVDSDDARAQALIAEAVAEYNAGRFAEAYALFGRAHETQPTARTLRGLGMAAFEMRDYPRALRALKSALSAQERPLSADQRERLQTLIAHAESQVGQYSLRITPESATVSVDGEAVVLSDDRLLLLSPGTHELRVECADCRSWSRQLVVEGGEVVQIEIDNSAATAVAPDEPTSGHPPVGPLVLGGLGVAMAIGGAAAGGVALGKQSELEEACPTRRECDPALEDVQNDANTAARVADVLFIAGAAAATTALIWWLVGGDDEGDAIQADLGCGPTGCTAAMRVALP